MNGDNDLKLTLHKVVSYAVLRMESTSDANVRRCIFQEYKEWLGTSIDSMPEMLKQGDQKACFQLDDHEEGGGVLTFKELDLIENHSIKNHTIIIDDNSDNHMHGNTNHINNTIINTINNNIPKKHIVKYIL